jgi:primosomal protein N' (replication factor Y)
MGSVSSGATSPRCAAHRRERGRANLTVKARRVGRWGGADGNDRPPRPTFDWHAAARRCRLRGFDDAMIVAVHPLAGFDKVLHYRVPAAQRHAMQPGVLVRVPLGRRHVIALVAERDPVPDVPPERLKNTSQVIYPFPAFTPDLLQLARWIATYYAAPLDLTIEAMIPASVRRGMALRTEKRLAAAGTPGPEELAALQKRAPQQARLYAFLRQQLQPVAKSLVLARLKVGPASVAGLVARGWATETEHRIERHAYADELAVGERVAALPPVLNAEQTAAVASISRSLAAGGFAVHLLHGVTGSGKTEVYLHALATVLAQGGGGMFLVPEVALTPQTVARLRSRLEEAGGHRVVVWHSHLSEGERLDGWLALAAGEARVVVGARSAVFAPVRDLRLVVVDEEHEPAYKQDETPRYHGRDVAVYRASLNGAVCVLGSATPSAESVRNVRRGRYRLEALPRRIDDRRLPLLQIVDMRREFTKARVPATLSRALVEKLADRFERREQTILFINRRGYSSTLLCQECGFVMQCPHCSITLTYHRTDETARCHLCGHRQPAPLFCPQCQSPRIRWRGSGTQKVEEAVVRLLPAARVVRIDTDVLQRKNTFREILGDFRTGKIDVLVGTQMIAKGLDFPNVTLVGLVDADISLHVPDFRANERTFQLLVQVAGRAGRGDRAGEVIVQTFTPQAAAIQFAKQSDFDGFIETELKLREDFGYPPYRHLVHHLFRGPNPEKLQFVAEHWARQVEAALGAAVEVRGPAPSPIERIEGEYRYQVWYFTTQVTSVVATLARMRAEFPWPEGMVQTLDVDPANLV